MKSDWKSITLKTVIQILTLTFVLASCKLVMAQSEAAGASRRHKPCSNRTLFGDYGTKLEGTILGPNLTLRTLVLAHFDGEGNMTSKDYVVLNGLPPAEEWRQLTGTYTVNPDCTGSATVDVAPGQPSLRFHFIVVKDGQEILEVVDGSAVSGIAYKVNREHDERN
jgi:hypothetical protein